MLILKAWFSLVVMKPCTLLKPVLNRPPLCLKSLCAFIYRLLLFKQMFFKATVEVTDSLESAFIVFLYSTYGKCKMVIIQLVFCYSHCVKKRVNKDG